MVISEDIKTLELMRKTLGNEKFEVLETLSAEDALDILEKEDVNLAICNVQMSGMSGIEFLNELHSWDTDIPVILTSEHAKEKEWRDALHADASAFLTKPFKKEEILKAVHKALEEHAVALAREF